VTARKLQLFCFAHLSGACKSELLHFAVCEPRCLKTPGHLTWRHLCDQLPSPRAFPNQKCIRPRRWLHRADKAAARAARESIAHFLFDRSTRSESDLAQVEYTYKFPLFFVHFLLRASCAINYPKEKNHFITGGGVYPHTHKTQQAHRKRQMTQLHLSSPSQPHLDQKEDVGLSLSPFSIVTHKAMLFWRLEQ